MRTHTLPAVLHGTLFGAFFLTALGAPEVVAQDVEARPSGRPVIVAATVAPETPQARPAQYGLKRSDYKALVETLPNLHVAIPVREMIQEARVGERKTKLTLVGTTADYAEIHRVEIDRGRFLTEADLQASQNVVVLPQPAVRDLFGDEDPLGRSVRMGRNYFVVVGILERGAAQEHPDAFIPLSAMRARFGDRLILREAGSFQLNHYELSRIELVLSRREQLESTVEIVEKLLGRFHADETYRIKSYPLVGSRR